MIIISEKRLQQKLRKAASKALRWERLEHEVFELRRDLWELKRQICVLEESIPEKRGSIKGYYIKDGDVTVKEES